MITSCQHYTSNIPRMYHERIITNHHECINPGSRLLTNALLSIMHHQLPRIPPFQHHRRITNHPECIDASVMQQSYISHASPIITNASRTITNDHERLTSYDECITNTSRMHHDCGGATTTVVGVKKSVISGKYTILGLN